MRVPRPRRLRLRCERANCVTIGRGVGLSQIRRANALTNPISQFLVSQTTRPGRTANHFQASQPLRALGWRVLSRFECRSCNRRVFIASAGPPDAPKRVRKALARPRQTILVARFRFPSSFRRVYSPASHVDCQENELISQAPSANEREYPDRQQRDQPAEHRS